MSPEEIYPFIFEVDDIVSPLLRGDGVLVLKVMKAIIVAVSAMGVHDRNPEVLWAQRSDKVNLTVALPDATDISIKCQPQGLFSFAAVGIQGETFEFSLELFGRVVPEACKTKVGLRNIICSIQKEEKGWWKRLLKTEEKPAPYIKVDWNKWCDEDDEESSSEFATDDDDDGAYASEDDGSSDEEGMLYLPDLEKARGN